MNGYRSLHHHNLLWWCGCGYLPSRIVPEHVLGQNGTNLTDLKLLHLEYITSRAQDEKLWLHATLVRIVHNNTYRHDTWKVPTL